MFDYRYVFQVADLARFTVLPSNPLILAFVRLSQLILSDLRFYFACPAPYLSHELLFAPGALEALDQAPYYITSEKHVNLALALTK